MSSPKLDQFERQLKAVLTPGLLAHGFTRLKPGREFARPSPRGDDIHHLISFQVGPATSSQAGTYTVELGLYYPAFARKMDQPILKPSIRHSNLNLRPRLGFLFPKPEDKWWPMLADEAGQAAQFRDVLDQLVSLALPWFEANDTAENATKYNTGKKSKRA